MRDERDDPELSDYLRILRRRWPWVLAGYLFIVVAATAFTVQQAPRYCSTAQVLLADSAAQVAILGDANVASSNRDLANELNLAVSDTIRAEVVNQLGLEPKVDIQGDAESDFLSFEGCGPTAADAALYANTWASVYVDVKQQEAADSISGAVESLRTRLSTLRDSRADIRVPLDELEQDLANADTDVERSAAQARVDRKQAELQVELDLIDVDIQSVAGTITQLQLGSELARTGTARLTQTAAEPPGPANAPLSRNLVLGSFAGLIVGAVLALLADNLDRSLKTPDDVVGAPVLGAIPRAVRSELRQDLALAAMNSPESAVAEGYQKVRTALEFALLGRKVKSILITSPSQGEGKSTSSANLAWAMSAIDHRVVLVDVDFRRPRIHKIFGCPIEPGLSDNLLQGTEINKLALRVEDKRGNLVIIPSGPVPSSPGDFVASRAFSGLLNNLEDESDLVILDSTPVLPVPDALSIARHVDAVIVVAMAGETSKAQLSTAIQSLRGVGADVLGVVLVGVKGGASKYSYERDAPIRARRELTAGLVGTPGTAGGANAPVASAAPVAAQDQGAFAEQVAATGEIPVRNPAGDS